MCTRQREICLVVIEGRRIPRSRCMTLRAVMIKVVGDMIRVSDAFECSLVTGIAVG